MTKKLDVSMSFENTDPRFSLYELNTNKQGECCQKIDFFLLMNEYYWFFLK